MTISRLRSMVSHLTPSGDVQVADFARLAEDFQKLAVEGADPAAMEKLKAKTTRRELRQLWPKSHREGRQAVGLQWLPGEAKLGAETAWTAQRLQGASATSNREY